MTFEGVEAPGAWVVSAIPDQVAPKGRGITLSEELHGVPTQDGTIAKARSQRTNQLRQTDTSGKLKAGGAGGREGREREQYRSHRFMAAACKAIVASARSRCIFFGSSFLRDRWSSNSSASDTSESIPNSDPLSESPSASPGYAFWILKGPMMHRNSTPQST